MSNGSGIITRTYKSGSIIYFENDKSDYIYVLKAGRVVLTSRKLDTGEEVKEEVRQGEFFGVKSSLGKYPREETAQTIGDAVVLVMGLAEFEKLVLRNVNVVRKMLRVFSNQLRRIGKMVRSVLGDTEDINPEVELFRIGEFYFKEGNLQRAVYAYKKYMEHYPSSQYAGQALQRIKAINSGAVKPADADDDLMPMPKSAPAPAAAPSDDFSFDDAPAKEAGDLFDFDDQPTPKPGTRERSELSGEMADFMDSGESLDDFTFEESHDMPRTATVFELNNDAADLMASGDNAGALELYQQAMAHAPKNEEEKKVVAKAYLGAGRCLMELGKQRDAFEAFSQLVKQFPSSEYVKNALFYCGQIFESARQKDKALAYYTKVLNMEPKGRLNSDAMARIKALQGS